MNVGSSCVGVKNMFGVDGNNGYVRNGYGVCLICCCCYYQIVIGFYIQFSSNSRQIDGVVGCDWLDVMCRIVKVKDVIVEGVCYGRYFKMI